MVSPLNLLEALLPSASTTSFPVPPLVQAGGLTCESMTLAGLNMPGQWLLTKATKIFGWQIAKGLALDGASMKAIGDDPMSIEFAIKIWTNLDAQVFRTALKTILRKAAFMVPGSPVTAAMGIDQSQLKDLGVTAVVLKSVTPLMNPLVTSGGKGPWTATVEFYEYRQPLAAIASPSQAIPDKSPPQVTAETAGQIEIQRLNAQFAAKTGALAQRLLGGPKP